MANITASLLVYDIPDGTRIANPSNALRSRGVRINLSCWIIPNSMIPYSLLNRLRQRNCDYHLVEFAASQSDRLIDIAKRTIQADLTKAIESLKASHRFAAENKLDGSAYAQKMYLRCVYNACKRTQTALKDLNSAADAFGLNTDELNYTHAILSIAGIKSHATAGIDVYAEAIEQARKFGYDAEAIVAAADADKLHPLILADWLEDHGIDATALRTYFG